MRVFFFFQAEDGIRDRNVTGVQTCALPISAPPLVGPERRHLPLPERPGPGQRLIQPQLQLPPEHPGMRPQQPLDSGPERGIRLIPPKLAELYGYRLGHLRPDLERLQPRPRSEEHTSEL